MEKFTSKKVLTILIVGPMPPLIGGISTYVSDLLNSNLKEKFYLIPFTTNRPSNKDKIPTVHNYNVIFGFSLTYSFKSAIMTTYHLLTFPVILLKKKPDLVHIHTSSYWSFLENSFYVLVSKLFRKSIVIHIHGSDFDNFYLNGSFLMKKYIYVIMSSTNRVIALSKYWKQFFINEIGLHENKIVVIYNSVMSSKYNKRIMETDYKNNLRLLFIGGQDSKRKGAYEVIKAIPLVLDKNPSVEFIFIGRGQIEEIKKMCNDLNIDKNVQILGQVSDDEKIKALNSSDIFLLPSHAEGLPISILEAMAAGLAIISTTVGSIPEVIEEGINGYLIKPRDYKALAEKILLLTENKKLLKEIRDSNIEKVTKNYDLEITLDRLEKLYLKTSDGLSSQTD